MLRGVVVTLLGQPLRARTDIPQHGLQLFHLSRSMRDSYRFLQMVTAQIVDDTFLAGRDIPALIDGYSYPRRLG